MARIAAWQRIERQQVRQRDRHHQRLHPRETYEGERPEPRRPAGTDLLPQVKHIVVLMMENHSFDNYLGALGRGDGFSLGEDGAPDAENPDSTGEMVRAYRASSTVQAEGIPCQSWSASHRQWAGGKLNGFVITTQRVAPGWREDRR